MMQIILCFHTTSSQPCCTPEYISILLPWYEPAIWQCTVTEMSSNIYLTWSRSKLEFQSSAAKAALVIIPDGLEHKMSTNKNFLNIPVIVTFACILVVQRIEAFCSETKISLV